MAEVSFPSSPSDGDTFQPGNGSTYTYDSTDNKWTASVDASSGTSIVPYSDSTVYTEGDHVFFTNTNREQGIYEWTSSTDSVAGTDPNDDTTNWVRRFEGQNDYIAVNSTGTAASATGSDALAIGEGATSTNTRSTAVGTGADATDAYTTAYGYNARATENNSTALGANTIADGANSIAIGGSNSFSTGADAGGSSAIAIGFDALAEHTNSVALGTGAETALDDEIMLGQDSADGSIGVCGRSETLYRETNTNIVWSNTAQQAANNMIYPITVGTTADPDEWARHNFDQFKILGAGNVSGNNADEINFYPSDVSGITDAKAGALSHIVKAYNQSNGAANYTNGFVVRTFHYNSDGKLYQSNLFWIDTGETAVGNTERNNIFGNVTSSDLWTDADSNNRHNGDVDGGIGRFTTGHWMGFERDAAEVDLSSSGNVIMLGQQSLVYSSNNKLRGVRYFGTRRSA